MADSVEAAFGGALAAATPYNAGFATAMSTIAGFGVGGVLVPCNVIAVYACPDAFIATTMALGLSVRFLGGSIGNTIYFNIFNNKIKTQLPAQVAEFAVNADLPAAEVLTFVKIYLTAPANAMSISGVTPQILQAAALGLEMGICELDEVCVVYEYSFRYIGRIVLRLPAEHEEVHDESCRRGKYNAGSG